MIYKCYLCKTKIKAKDYRDIIYNKAYCYACSKQIFIVIEDYVFKKNKKTGK